MKMDYITHLEEHSSWDFGVRIEFAISIAVVLLVVLSTRVFSLMLAGIDFLLFRAYIPYLLGGVGISYLYLAYRDLAADHFGVRWPNSNSIRIFGGLSVTIVGLLLLGVVAADILLDAPLSEFTGYYFDRQISSETALKFLLGSALFIAPAKEALFRGAVQGTLREASTERVAIVTTSTLYVGYHAYFLGLGAGIPGTVLFLGVLGVTSLALGTAKERTSNLLFPMVGASLLEVGLFVLAYVRVIA